VDFNRLISAGQYGMTVERFQDRDADYLDWMAENHAGYVINVSRSGRGIARLHRASCRTITSRPPFTGPYIKICATTSAALDQWALSNSGALPEHCGTCHPSPGAAAAQQSGPPGPVARVTAEKALKSGPVATDEWEIEGPGASQRQVRFWSTRYIPFERLTPGQHAARDALQDRIRSLAPAASEILHATYTGYKPPGMDVENLLLYNIGSSCFRPGTRHGVRFELGHSPWPDPPSGRRLACCYQYRLIDPDTDLSHWRPIRRLADFTGADLGLFPSAKRLEQVWLAVHGATLRVEGQPDAITPFSVFLTLGYPTGRPIAATPELVKALIDGTVAAFQAHGNRQSVKEVAARVSATTSQPIDLIAETLLDDRHAVLGVVDKLLYPRGDGVQWNPGDQLCMTGQILVQPISSSTWTLSGQIYSVEPAQ
jgi:hypothetical protein